MKIVELFEFEAETNEGQSDFIRCFEEVWHLVLNANEREAISKLLTRVVWTINPERVSQRPPGLTVAITQDSGREVAFLATLLVGSDRNRLTIIAHELRHVWQFATNFAGSDRLRMMATRMAWENDAIEFAHKRVGKESNVPALVEHGLPYDDNFDRLVDAWGYLATDQQIDVLELAAGLAESNKRG